MSKRRGLGRGLDALLAGSAEPQPVTTADAPDQSAKATSPDSSGISSGIAGLGEVPLDQIFRGQFQPRRHFDEAALDDLAASIKSQGLMQPIVLRPRAIGGFEIIAGERRWRAAQRAG